MFIKNIGQWIENLTLDNPTIYGLYDIKQKNSYFVKYNETGETNTCGSPDTSNPLGYEVTCYITDKMPISLNNYFLIIGNGIDHMYGISESINITKEIVQSSTQICCRYNFIVLSSGIFNDWYYLHPQVSIYAIGI